MCELPSAPIAMVGGHTSERQRVQIVTMLTETQWATLRALIDRLIPADDFPSGWEAGVGDYLDRQFAGDLSDVVDLYRSGLDALDVEARTTAGVRTDSQHEAACVGGKGRNGGGANRKSPTAYRR